MNQTSKSSLDVLRRAIAAGAVGNWVMILIVLFHPAFRTVDRNLASSAFTVFKVSAIIGVLLLPLAARGTPGNRGASLLLLLDTVLIVLMLLFWLIAVAASY